MLLPTGAGPAGRGAIWLRIETGLARQLGGRGGAVLAARVPCKNIAGASGTPEGISTLWVQNGDTAMNGSKGSVLKLIAACLPVAACFMWMTGCPGPQPECVIDADCPGGQVCDDGECVAGPVGPAATFPTSLHRTRAGKQYFYEGTEAQPGFLTLTGVAYDALACSNCHPSSNLRADGTAWDATVGATCADCHADPANPTGDVADAVCLGCHSRQGAEQDVMSDVHRDLGYGCVDCHSALEMHGDGRAYNSLFEAGAMDTKCENCHIEDGQAGAPPTNSAHTIHANTVECSACHVQSVITCYNCHFESEVAGAGKRFFSPPRTGFKFLVNRNGKVNTATFQALVYEGQTFYVIAPYYAHGITASPRCDSCHNNAAAQEYAVTGVMTVTQWDAATGTLTGPTGTIPVPPDWITALRFDFLDYTGDPATPIAETDPTLWQFLKTEADLTQMLFAEPLTQEQIERLE